MSCHDNLILSLIEVKQKDFFILELKVGTNLEIVGLLINCMLQYIHQSELEVQFLWNDSRTKHVHAKYVVFIYKL